MIATARHATVLEAIEDVGHDEDFEPAAGPDFLPTDAPAGSQEKIEVLRRRVELGHPLWHADDRTDYSLCDGLGPIRVSPDRGCRQGARSARPSASEHYEDSAETLGVQVLDRCLPNLETLVAHTECLSVQPVDNLVAQDAGKPESLIVVNQSSEPAEGGGSSSGAADCSAWMRSIRPTDGAYLCALRDAVSRGLCTDEYLQSERRRLGQLPEDARNSITDLHLVSWQEQV